MCTPSHTNVRKLIQFSTYIFSADITPEMLKLCRLSKVKVFFLVLGYVFNFVLFEFSATTLEKDLFLTAKLLLSLRAKYKPDQSLSKGV